MGGAGSEGAEGSEALLRLGVRPRARKLLVAAPQRLAHPQREGGDERRGDEEGDPAAAQVQEGDVFAAQWTFRKYVQERECQPANEGEGDRPPRGQDHRPDGQVHEVEEGEGIVPTPGKREERGQRHHVAEQVQAAEAIGRVEAAPQPDLHDQIRGREEADDGEKLCDW